MSKIQKPLSLYGVGKKSAYDWEKTMDPKVLARHRWLVETWSNLYFSNLEDKFLRTLSTDDIMKTKWFEKYGVREPSF